MKNILVVTPDRNSDGKKDFTGAFLPEALAFATRHGATPKDVLLRIDVSQPEGVRRKQLLTRLESATGLEAVAFFCHGLTKKLPQLGWSVSNVGELSKAIAKSSKPSVKVVLYACSAGEGEGPAGDNGFADRLRDTLCENSAVQCQVDAHERAAHTTRNPFVRRFEGLGSPVGGPGGYFLVTPGSGRWQMWREKLRTPFRFEFPFLSAAEIQTSL